MENITLKFRLRLLDDEWGKHKKGDEEDFYIPLLSEDNGLVRYSIDKRWEIILCSIDVQLVKYAFMDLSDEQRNYVMDGCCRLCGHNEDKYGRCYCSPQYDI